MESGNSTDYLLMKQRENVRKLYDETASVYDEEFEQKADYQVPEILQEIYQANGFISGSILDIGCGTGKLNEYLDHHFDYTGIDLSEKMLEVARTRGAKTLSGPAEEVLKTLSDKSFDHVVALSSLYFIEDFANIICEMERIARHSFFITLERFTPETINDMKKKGISLYNHSSSAIANPTKIFTNTFLWQRPVQGEKIYGDIVFKKLEA